MFGIICGPFPCTKQKNHVNCARSISQMSAYINIRGSEHVSLTHTCLSDNEVSGLGCALESFLPHLLHLVPVSEADIPQVEGWAGRRLQAGASQVSLQELSTRFLTPQRGHK